MVMVALSLVGCATMFSGGRQQVQVTSRTEGAEVMIDGAPYGRTPAMVALDNTKSHTIVITRDDGETFTCALNSSVGVGWVILDILGGLFPVIIDAATGKWKSLDQTVCHSPR